jgi:hypothetical protein
MHSPFYLLEELLEAIAKTLVDHPEEVQVRAVQGQAVSILELCSDSAASRWLGKHSFVRLFRICSWPVAT